MVKSIALLTTALWISFASGCNSRQPVIASGSNSSQTAGQAKVLQTQQKNWGQPIAGLRTSIDIEPAAVDDTSPRSISLTFRNSSEAEMSFKPFITLHLYGLSHDNSFSAPADITMPKPDFSKREFPEPPNGQPMISLAAGESKTFSFRLDDLGWDTFKSSYYRAENFYKRVPAGKYELVADIELWDAQTKTDGRIVKIPKRSSMSSGKIKLQVSLRDSHKVIAVEN